MNSTAFEIEKGNPYLIKENSNADTPVELQKEGRAKMGGNFFEWATTPYYDEVAQKYDTGLDSTSKEFIGKTESEIEKVLDKRKDLIAYHKRLVDTVGDERKVVAANRLKLEHNKIVDTRDIGQYYQLYMAYRGGSIVPLNDRGNLVRSKKAMYVIVNQKQEVNRKDEIADMKFKAQQWLYARLGKSPNRKQALEYLRYCDILTLNEDKSDSLLTDVFNRVIEDYEKLTNFLYAVETVKEDDIYMTNDIRKLILKGVIRREKGNYVYDGIEIGSTNVQDIVKNLKKKEFQEIAVKLLNR